MISHWFVYLNGLNPFSFLHRLSRKYNDIQGFLPSELFSAFKTPVNEPFFPYSILPPPTLAQRINNLGFFEIQYAGLNLLQQPWHVTKEMVAQK